MTGMQPLIAGAWQAYYNPSPMAQSVAYNTLEQEVVDSIPGLAYILSED